MNTIKKGKLAQKEARRQLESAGWVVDEARASRFQPQDFFGCWDFICLKEGKGYVDPEGHLISTQLPQIRWVQVSASPLSKRGREYREKLEAFIGPGIKEYWHWDGEVFNITAF